MHLHTLVFPTDFSACAQAALGHAAALARLFDAELHLLHVWSPQAVEPYGSAGLAGSLRELAADADGPAADRLRALARHPALAGLRLVTASRRDVAAGAAIVDYGREQQAGLIVMGTHGRNGPIRLLLGSVAEDVVRHAASPVLTVRHNPEGDDPSLPGVGNLLVPFDFSPASRDALRTAAALARRLHAGLTLLHVLDEAEPAVAVGLRARGALAREAAGRTADLQRRLAEHATALAPGIACRLVVEVGRPPSEILRHASRPDVDLVVMGSGGLRGIKRLLFATTGEEVVRLSSAPVLVVKAPQATEEPSPPTARARAVLPERR